MSEELDPQDESPLETDSDESSVDVSSDESVDEAATEPKAGPSNSSSKKANPFFNKAKRSKTDEDVSESDSESEVSDSDADSDDDEDEEEFTKPEPEVDEEDPVIKALKKAKEKAERNCPPDLTSPDQITDLSFHPNESLIAHAAINGHVFINSFSNEENAQKLKLKLHKGNIRTLEFDSTGRYLYSGGKDKSFKILDVEAESVKFTAAGSHDSPLYKIKPINEFLVATGDEDGTVKLWDSRQSKMSKPVMEEKQFDDAVTDIFYDVNVDPKIIVASSSEGMIQSYSLGGKKADMQSEMYDGEMNSMAVVKKNSKLVVGCGDGKLYMFNWREFGYHSAEFPGHPDAINCLIGATDNVILTACEDGAIRAVHLYPHRFVGTVGHHENSFPIEKMDVSSTGEILASISHDNCVKFWNISYLEEMDYNKTKKPFHQKKGLKMRRKENKMQRAQEQEYQLPSSQRGNRKDFFKGMLEDD